MSSDNSSPFVVSSKVPPIRHVRLIRNSSLPSLQSLISHPQSKKTYEPLSSQLSGRPKPALPNLPANPPIQNVNAIVAYDTFLDLEPLRVQNPPRLRKLTDSYRVSASDVRSKCLTDRTREEISSSITERYKPKIMEARRSAREIPKIANTFREKEMGRKNKSLNRIVTQSIDALPSVVDNENKKTEEDKEDNNNSTELNWESEKEEAVEIRNSTEEDQVTQDMSSMLGRRDTMKTPNGQVLRQALRKKSVEEDGLTQDMSSVFGRRDTMKTPNNQVLRQVYREKSADQTKCARCKKCEYCISCTKCSVLSQCMDCQTCPRCVKCPKCFEKDDLSPTREIKLRNVYFERYKGMEELERKDFLEKNPRDTYLKKCKDQRVLPFPLDLYNEEGKTGKKMEIKFYRLGNERANALASSIGINTDLENIDLTRIGLEGKGIAEILEKLTTNVKSLELTENKLDGVGLTALCMVITNRRYGNLRVLKLEGMGMGEKQGEVLANALIDNSFIKVLNLSRNRLGDRTMVNLAKFIEDSTTIQQLYLHWNNIMSKGCLLLCDSVVKSNTLKVLDVSWNRIGNHYNLSSAEKLAYMFRNNVSVVHLDFSFCGFREQECAIMAEGLLLNHTILGIHMTGNKWMTDDQGFMNRIVDNETSIIKDALWRRIPQHGEKVIHHPKSSKTTGNCWICEGWREVKFVWNTKEKEDADFEPVHIHLSFDNWKGHLMARESSTSWVLYKMCPPGNLQFFFSLRGGEKADLGNYNEAIEKLPESFKLHNAGQTKAPLTQNLKVPAVNMMCVDYFELLVSETLDLAIEKCVPRPKVEVLPVVEDTWRFAKSIFRYFRRDNLDLERRCFEFDFECSRISQIIRIEQELPGVKEELWKIYPKMRITYKYYSSLTPVGEIFSVPLNSYTEFITKTGVVDNKNLALHAIDKNFIATKSFGKNKFIRSPDKALVRYQFMEILVRCAIDKYYLSNCGCSYTEAVAKIVKEITPHCEEFNHEAFRLKRLWNPFCDFMFRSNIGIMRRLYEKYCDHKRKLKGRNTMNLADFYKFCRDARLINVFLYEREPILIFNLAMMTQVDELNYGRHTRMFFVEFLDAFARLADKIIPTPDNPLPDLHDKIGELIKISAIKCLGEEDYHVFSPPDHLRALKIDLSPYPPKEK